MGKLAKRQNGDNFCKIPWQHLNAVADEVVAESETHWNKSAFDDIKSESESKTNLNKSDFDDIKCKSESKTNLN